MPESEQVREYKEATTALLKKIDAYEKAQAPILIDEKEVIKVLAKAMIAASPLISIGWLAKGLAWGGQILINMFVKEK